MIKKLFICLSIGIMAHISAMEPLCYFAQMPQDAQNLIVHFLTCDDETEEEFIARTQKVEALDLMPYYQYIQNFNVEKETFGARCFDGTKIALLHFFNGYLQQFATVTIVNSEKKDTVSYPLQSRDYTHIALFPKANMIATIEKGRIHFPGLPVYDGYVMILYNLNNKRDRTFPISKDFTPSSIAFDRQGRHIIVRGLVKIGNNGKSGVLQRHRIVPLIERVEDSIKTSEKLISKVDNKSIPFLQKYFAEKGVCKSIGYSSIQ